MQQRTVDGSSTTGALEDGWLPDIGTWVPLRPEEVKVIPLERVSERIAAQIAGPGPQLTPQAAVTGVDMTMFQTVIGLEADGVTLDAQIRCSHEEVGFSGDVEHQRQPNADELLDCA